MFLRAEEYILCFATNQAAYSVEPFELLRRPTATLKIHFRKLVILLLHEVVYPKPVHKLLWHTNILITLGTYSPSYCAWAPTPPAYYSIETPSLGDVIMISKTSAQPQPVQAAGVDTPANDCTSQIWCASPAQRIPNQDKVTPQDASSCTADNSEDSYSKEKSKKEQSKKEGRDLTVRCFLCLRVSEN